MKRFFLPLAVAAFCGLPQAAAVSADSAEAELMLKPGEAKIEQVSPRAEYFATKETAKAISPAWHMVRIPYTLRGKARGDQQPLFVDELKVHAYLVFSVGKDGEEIMMVDKEITYVDIPLSPRSDVSENKNVQAAVFISPSDAVRICADDAKKADKADLSGKLAAVAVEFSFKGENCNKSDAPCDVVVDKKMKNRLKKQWWKKEYKGKIVVTPRAISETPFAPFYAPAFPATKPMYGEAGAAPAPSSYTTTTDMGGYTPSSATTPDTADDSSADAEPAETPKKKGKKRRK